MQIDATLPSTFPRQKLPRSQKDINWQIQNVNYITRMSSFLGNNTHTNSFLRKKVNYDLYNGFIDQEDFEYVTNPYKTKDKFPARLQNFNIITPKLKLLEGEEIKRPFNFRVAAVNSDAVSQIEEKKKDLLLKYFESELSNDLSQQGHNIQNPIGQTMDPSQIDKYMTYSDVDIRESVANQLANYLIKKENLEFKFNKAFKDALITSEEIYYVGIDHSDPICEVVNPLDFDFDRNPDIDFIQDGQWAFHVKYCTNSEIIDMFYDDLTDDEIDRLDVNNNRSSINGTSYGEGIPFTNSPPAVFDGTHRQGYITVIRVEWKSMRKIGFLTYYDENAQPQEMVVDETYKPVKSKGESVEWVWVNEVWEGYKIGANIFKRIRPKSVQYRSMDNPSICKLGYVGVVYNNRNTVPVSLIDIVKHHQYLYNITMYRLELELAKAKGKKMVMDLAQIPRSQGIDLDKWMYYFDTVGIAFVNSFEEGKGKFQGQTSSFNQFTAVDMSLSQSVGQYIEILNKLEEMVGSLMGVTRQREGAITSSETVGGVERAVTQSSNITEPLFYMHNEAKKHVLTQLIECAKVAYPEGKKISYITSDLARILFTIDDGFINADYGVFVTNSSREIKALDDLKALAQQGISSGMISFSELVSIIDSNSIADVKNTVIRSEQKAQQEKQQEQQQEQELQQQAAQQQLENQMKLQDRLDQREILKGNIQKELHEIDALGYAKDTDIDNDGVPDVLEVTKLQQEANQHKDKMSLENRKLDEQIRQSNIDKNLQEKKLAVEKLKAKSKSTK